MAQTAQRLDLASYVELARETLAGFQEPAPCGHTECSDKDREIANLATEVGVDQVAEVEQLDVDLEDAAKIVALIDEALVLPGLDLMFVPVLNFHAVLMATVVALFDAANTPVPEEAQETVAS